MKVIVITGADARYFDLARGAILSVREKPQAQDVALGFLDLGCTREQESWLTQHVDFIRRPDWDFHFPARETAPGYLRGLLCRPFFRRYFPGFDVYVWIDADAWVNHWSAVQLMVQGAVKRGLAVVPEMDRGYRVHYGKWRSLHEYMYGQYCRAFGRDVAEKMSDYPVINAGVFALRQDAPHWEPWAYYLNEILQHHAGLMTDQLALNWIIYAKGLFDRTELLPAVCNWTCHLGVPCWDPAQQMLVEPYLPHQPIGIMHLIHANTDGALVRLATTDGGTIETSLRYQRKKMRHRMPWSVYRERLADAS